MVTLSNAATAERSHDPMERTVLTGHVRSYQLRTFGRMRLCTRSAITGCGISGAGKPSSADIEVTAVDATVGASSLGATAKINEPGM